jgi:hypothetical protein
MGITFEFIPIFITLMLIVFNKVAAKNLIILKYKNQLLPTRIWICMNYNYRIRNFSPSFL